MMGAKTGIEWTDATWNPIRGCSRVSEGCRHCYAETMATRFSGPGLAYEGLAVMQNGQPHWTGKIEFVEKHLLDPLKWKPITEYKVLGNPSIRQLKKRGGLVLEVTRPRRIFVNSMSDLFHENVTDEMRDKIFAVMALCPQHIFQVLTKRPERMLEYMSGYDVCAQISFAARAVIEGNRRSFKVIPRAFCESPYNADRILVSGGVGEYWPLANVWLGVSDEGNQHQRIDLLRDTPAAVRFVSAEPLLFDPGEVNLGGIDWVICGGESGPGARPMHPDWARSLRDQCSAAGVPFFFKQWGEWVPTTDPKIAAARGVPLETCMSYVGKKNAGALLDGVEWKQFPEVKGE